MTPAGHPKAGSLPQGPQVKVFSIEINQQLHLSPRFGSQEMSRK
jgi:hypothetical protein